MQQQTSQLRLARRALRGDHYAAERLDCSDVCTVGEAGRMLDLLARVSQSPGKYHDPGIMAVVRTLEYARTPVALRFILRVGLPLLDRLAGRLPPGSGAWGQILHAMAHWATKGSRRSLRFWLRRFLAPDPGRKPEMYELAVAALLDREASCTRHLFPQLLQALACPSKKLAVTQLADAVFECGHVQAHPLGGHPGEWADTLRAVDEGHPTG